MRNILVENYTLPAVHRQEVLRYAGVKEGGEELLPLIEACEKECAPVLAPKVCFLELTLDELFAVIPAAGKSKGLLKTLGEAKKAVVFAATLGIGIDRWIARYAAVAPSKAVLLQALGGERIESLCDQFCTEKNLGKRYSPGYGDFSLIYQREIFNLLHCEKIGLTLTESMMMSPTKSVTAIAGVGTACEKSCPNCDKRDCVYRK